MSFIPFSCSFCAACVPIRSWYAFKIHLNTKRHSTLALKREKEYLANYRKYFPINNPKVDEMTDHWEVERIAFLRSNWEARLLEIITEDLQNRRGARKLGGEPDESYCLLCVPCNKEFQTFSDGMTHRTSQKHIDKCREVGCEEFKLTFPLVESEEEEEASAEPESFEEETVTDVKVLSKVLKVRSRTPSPTKEESKE